MCFRDGIYCCNSQLKLLFSCCTMIKSRFLRLCYEKPKGQVSKEIWSDCECVVCGESSKAPVGSLDLPTVKGIWSQLRWCRYDCQSGFQMVRWEYFPNKVQGLHSVVNSALLLFPQVTFTGTSVIATHLSSFLSNTGAISIPNNAQ